MLSFLSRKGRIIDAVGRAVGKKQPQVVSLHGEADYYTVGSGKILLIVEDVVSAIIATQELPYITAMAILGTSLVLNTWRNRICKVIIALILTLSVRRLSIAER